MRRAASPDVTAMRDRERHTHTSNDHDQVTSRALEAALPKYKHDCLGMTAHHPTPQRNAPQVYSIQCSLLLESHVLCTLIKRSLYSGNTYNSSPMHTSLESSCVSPTCASVSDSGGVSCPAPSIRGFSPSFTGP
jgi:hypothetical protein